MKFLAVLLVALVALVAAQQPPYKVCSAPNAPLQITGATFTPNPIKIGQNLAINVVGSLSEDLTGGSLDLEVSYYIAGFQTCTISNCPIKAGPQNSTHILPIPSITPAGYYKGKLTMTDQSNAQVACITFQIQMVSSLNKEEQFQIKM